MHQVACQTHASLNELCTPALHLIAGVYRSLNNGREKYTAEKLTATFHDRIKYAVHFANLKYYIEQGLILKKVHRVLAFRQTTFLRTYISWCKYCNIFH
jgi:hypothetical protein